MRLGEVDLTATPMDARFRIVAECWTCAHTSCDWIGCDETHCLAPELLTAARAAYHRQHGHDVRDVTAAWAARGERWIVTSSTSC